MSMKPYGSDDPIVRSDADRGDCTWVKASKRNLSRNSDGDIHNTLRNVARKAILRRTGKRIARRVGKAACKEI